MKNKREKRRIGAILIDDGLITQDQLDQALDVQKTDPCPIGEILISLQFINASQLASALGRQLKIPYIPLQRYSHNPDAAKWVGKNFCEKYTIVPFEGDDNYLYISVADPLDRNPVQTLQKLLNRRIFSFISTPDEINQMINQIFTKV